MARGRISLAGWAKGAVIAAVTLLCWLCSGSALAAPGDLDPSFGDQGIFAAPALGEGEYGYTRGIRTTPDGGSVALLYRSKGSPSITVVRLGADGRPLTTFANGGYFQPPAGFDVGGLAADPQGGIVLVGSVAGEGEYDRNLEAIRLTATGVPDPSFGDAGVAHVALPEKNAAPGDVIVTSDGSIVIATTVEYYSMTIVKLTADGSIDGSFASDGSTDPLDGAAAFIGIGPSGDLYLGGSTDFPTVPVVARFDPDGAPRASYGDHGVGTLPALYSDFSSGAGPFAIDGLGRVMAIVSASYEHGGSITELNRLDPNGDLDQAFDTSDALNYNPDAGTALYADDLTVDDQDRVLIAGSYRNFREPFAEAAVARLLPDGTLDDSFATGGVTAFPERALSSFYLASIARQPDGRLLIGGSTTIARMLVGPGPANADADSFADADDLCPRIPSPAGSPSGCPDAHVILTIKYTKGAGLSGQLVNPLGCRIESTGPEESKGAKIVVYRVRHGADKRIAGPRVYRGSGFWRVPGNQPDGHYYAKYLGFLQPDEGNCLPTRTKAVKIG